MGLWCMSMKGWRAGNGGSGACFPTSSPTNRHPPPIPLRPCTPFQTLLPSLRSEGMINFPNGFGVAASAAAGVIVFSDMLGATRGDDPNPSFHHAHHFPHPFPTMPRRIACLQAGLIATMVYHLSVTSPSSAN